jgi:tetratricopeptide (TPR) repeat protein
MVIKAGLSPGRWRITGTKGDLSGFFIAAVNLGEASPATLVLKAGKTAAAAVAASKLSPEEIAKRNKQSKELEDTFNAAKAALDAGNTDEAIVKLKSMTEQSPQCAVCFAKLGDVYTTKKDAAGAEASYKKAVDLDPTLGDVYVALAALYAEQKRFDEATAMSAKANSLSAATGGVGNPTALYNQGVILWNQGKGDEAQPLFEKAVAADPSLPDAHYMLGMIYVGKDKKADAIKELEAYLKLAPTGENAATAKAILAQIK